MPADRSVVRLEELDFELPEEAIAQRPAEPRDSCRLMHLLADGGFGHLRFADLPLLLRGGDTLVFNDSKVLPARVMTRKTSGGIVELLFLRPVSQDCTSGAERWEVLARPSQRLRVGKELVLPDGERLALVEHVDEGRWIVSGRRNSSMIGLMDAHGRLPLPPYIKTYPADPSTYQTVYAAVPGSAAAPAAGLHFTRGLLDRLGERGVGAVKVTLHVGLDTFLPIRERVVEEHRIHSETYAVAPEALGAIRRARSSGGRVVAVGTTAARVLETLVLNGSLGNEVPVEALSGFTDVFITPGHRFAAVDALLTNFHLPKSSVLALTMAFAGTDRLRRAYAEGLSSGYRFFSFGDAMLIEKPGREGSASEEGGGA